jgi:hypothetical protein
LAVRHWPVRETHTGTICYNLLVRLIDLATAAHIHVGDEDTAGPVVQLD